MQKSLLIPDRIHADELLDLGAGDIADVRTSLDDLWRINQYLGGMRSLALHLYPRLLRHAGTATIVDIGTGAAQIPQQIAHWARRRRKPVRIAALDFARRHLEIARPQLRPGNDMMLVQADALALPFSASSIDYVVSSLFLHHFAPEQVIQLLTRFYSCARCALLISDLERGWLPYYGFKMVQPVFARSYLTRYDGAVSVLRAYTASELLDFAHAAGIPRPQVHRHFPWRITLVAEKCQ